MTTGRFLPPSKGFHEEDPLRLRDVLWVIIGFIAVFVALEFWMLL